MQSPVLTARAKRVGMFGGAFDPPHLAHVALAEAAVRQLHLDVLHVFPTGKAWHRDSSTLAGEHRLAMAHVAFSGVPRVVVDDAELRRPGPTYTIDTLEVLHLRYPGAMLFLLLGADQAARIATWHRHADVLAMATLCAAARPTAAGQLDASAKMPVWLEMPPMDVSATDIRRRLAAGADVSTLVPEGVARYIAEHQLYSRP